MNFSQSISSVLWDNYAKFSGRASRSEFWWYRLFTLLIGLGFGLIFWWGGAEDWMFFTFNSVQTGQLGYIAAGPETGWMDFAMIASGLFGLYILIPTLAVTVRRFHDVGLSAWWLFILWFISVIFTSIWFYPWVAYIAALAIFIICVMPGREGQNQYGEEPIS